MLDVTLAQAANSGAVRAIDLQREEVVAANAHRPARVEVCDDAVLEFKGGIGRVIGGALVGLALFVDTLRNVGRTKAGNGLHFAEEIVEHIAPVAKHVDDDAAIIFFAVVPARALGHDVVAFENPVTEFTAHAEDFSEESLFLEALDLAHAGKPELVLDNAILHTGLGGDIVEIERVGGADGGGLFAVNMLARSDGFFDGTRATAGGLRVEVNEVLGLGEFRIEVGGPAHTFVHRGELRKLGLATTNEHRLGPDDFAVTDLQTALFADGEDRADVVLVGAHASGDAVHDDADFVFFHMSDDGWM